MQRIFKVYPEGLLIFLLSDFLYLEVAQEGNYRVVAELTVSYKAYIRNIERDILYLCEYKPKSDVWSNQVRHSAVEVQLIVSWSICPRSFNGFFRNARGSSEFHNFEIFHPEALQYTKKYIIRQKCLR